MNTSRYEVLQVLYQNEWSVVSRGRRREDGRAVLLKELRGDSPPGYVKLLKHEYEILRNLSLHGIPCAYGLDHHDRDWCLILEDRGGVPLQAMVGSRRMEPGAFLKIAGQLPLILAELHRRDVIHQQINPRSILIHPVSCEACLVDFSLASRTSHGIHPPVSLTVLRSGLPYMSPEQTGRTNRAIDYRTDFYSLGVTFYEVLTGSPPFQSNSPLELIHWHIAKTPQPPTELDSAIPEPLSQILMTLLAKTAEERYQSAQGLREDLEICAREWAAHRRIAPFALRRRDVSDRFLIPQKLYGRNREIEELLGAFDRACSGGAAMTLVTGYSGIGKTSLIQELYKPIIRQRGYFVAGKFDQIVRNVPHGAMIQASRGLMQQLLTESEDRLGLWHARLSETLGANAAVLAEVIPEIGLILGAQPAPPSLGPIEAQNRFQLAFQKFVGALAQPDHPLVVFLDDLQWTDTATLSLLQTLLSSPDVKYLFLIGAYRDNEVDASHPLMQTLHRLESGGVRCDRIVLQPLRLAELTLLVQDTLHGAAADVTPLAALVLEKTDGNPFFVLQFLKTLRQEGLIEFDHGQGRWTFRLEAIAAAKMTDNVIDLMTRRIQRLSDKSRHVLTLAACVGDPFDPNVLAIVSQQSPEDAAEDLRGSLGEGLILPAAGLYDHLTFAGGNPSAPAVPSYTFLHDRVQQAAYALIPEAQRRSVHLTVGRLLLERWDATTTEEHLFDVVHHLNLGRELITDPIERLALARLNLKAGRRAKSSTAYQSALGYFISGIGLLGEPHWDSEYDLMLALYLEAAECEYLCGHFDTAEHDFDRLLAKARTRLDKAKVYSLKILQYEHMSRYADAIRAGRNGLSLFGLTFPEAPEERQVALDKELAAITSLLGERAIDSLVELPIMEDPEIRALMHLLANLHTSCFLSGDKPLTLLNTATMVRLSLTHGNIAESAYAYALHAAMLEGPIREDYRAAYEFGTLALRLNERLFNPALRAKVLMMFAWAISPWRMPLEASLPITREAFRLGHETGLFVDAAWALFNEIWFAFLTSGDLEAFFKTYAANVEYSARVKMPHIADAKQILLQWGRALQGRTEHPLSFTNGTFDGEKYRHTYEGQRLFEMFYFVAKLAVLYTFDEFQAACEAARKAELVIQRDFTGTIWDELRVFYHALSLAALDSGAAGEVPLESMGTLETLQARLRRWAENSPHNFQPQALIVSAEIARVQGRGMEAMRLYEAAIAGAKTYRRLREEALANELYAKFLSDRRQGKFAAEFMAEARDRYIQWGALAKVADLERRYPDLLLRHGSEIPSGQTGAGSLASPALAETDAGVFDLSTVIRAAQTIAGEIELEKLLTNLMRITIENAGAERSCLILEHDGRPCVCAEGSLGASDVRLGDPIPLQAAQELPISLVNYVRRTLESVVLADAKSDDRYATDPYIQRRQPRSVLCAPVLHQGRLIGVLYLENNLTTDAFTPKRIELMQILAAQAAISLENSRLYGEMKQEVAARRQAEESLRAMHQFSQEIINGASEGIIVYDSALRYVVFNRFMENLTGKRAEDVLGKYAPDVFPFLGEKGMDVMLKRALEGETITCPDILIRMPTGCEVWELNRYAPHRDDQGNIIGVIALISDITQRKQMEEALRKALAEVEELKNRLQAENVYLQEEIRREHDFVEMVGNSPALLAALRKVEKVAATDSSVLIFGETGTGKELIARAIHSRSPRRDRPLVKVNCSAISAGLVESELFGHVKGAFTGALERRTGRFELADGGTIFLDEVGELPLETQVKLLRVLQEGEFEPVGSSTTLRVDVRVIAATNRNLEDAVRANRFRSDLFYRLNVFPLEIPPLRQRRSDIPQLVMYFLSRFSKKFGKHIQTVSQESMERLRSYPWPGNIRELQNLIERAVVLSQRPVLELDRELLPAPTAGVPVPVGSPAQSVRPDVRDRDESRPSADPNSPGMPTLEEMERNHILAALQQSRGVIEGPKGAAGILNLHPNTLRSRMKKLGIKRQSHEIS
jgi:PAS domain S-box-containing protein